MLFRTHRHKRHMSKIAELGVAGLFLSFGNAVIDTIWAIYLFTFLNSQSSVGFFSGIISIISFTIAIAIIPIIEKMDESKYLKWIIFIHALIYLAYAINRSFIILILLTLINILLLNARRISYGIVIRDESKLKDLSKNEGIKFTLGNIAWVIAPLVSGYVADFFSINIVFVLASAFTMIAFVLLSKIKLKKSRIPVKTHKNMIRNVLRFFKNRDRVSAYMMGLGVRFWWSFVYIYIPMEIIKQGYTTKMVGFLLFLVAIPLISFEYFSGGFADRNGFKIFFKLGYLLLALINFMLFFQDSMTLIFGLIFIASFVLAFIEPMQESYFFASIKKKDEDRYYPIFLTNITLSQFFCKFSIAGVLLFFSFNYAFLFVSLVMLTMFLLAFNIREPKYIKHENN